MQIHWQVVTFDAADLEAESSFWAGVLGGEVDVDGDRHMVVVDGQPRVGVQLAPDHVAPTWPAGEVPQQVHLDLWVHDPSAAHAEVIRRGATLLQGAHGGGDFAVYADPAGHPFCLCFNPSGGSLPDVMHPSSHD